jgi:hypothetical protein
MLSRTDVWLGALCLALGISSSGCGHLTLRRNREPQAPAPALPRFNEAPPPLPPSATNSPSVPNTAPVTQTAAPASAAPLALAMESGRDPAAPAAPKQTAADPRLTCRNLHRRAVERFAAMDSYIARFRRREQINGKDAPEEIIALQFRKQPWSVHMKWVGSEGTGREVVYVKGKYENKIHTLLAATDPKFPLGGNVVSLAPDSPFVRARSRYPITEAGIGALIERFGRIVDREAAKTRVLRYAGLQKRPEYEEPLEAVEEFISEEEAPAPRGGRRWWFFEPKSGLPVIAISYDTAGREVEYYCYDRIQAPVGLDDDDFNPDKLWKVKK